MAILIALLVPSKAEAQYFWTEIAVPQDSVLVYAVKGEVFTPKHFIRGGQQWVMIRPPLPAGVYLCRLQAGSHTAVRQVVLTGN